MAFLYVDPLSRDLVALKARMQDVTPRAAFDLTGEAAVIEVLTGLAEGRIADGDGRKALTELLGIGTRADPDVRILSRCAACATSRTGRTRWRSWAHAPGFRPRASCICSRPRPACRCGATGCGIAWARRSRHPRRQVADRSRARRGLCQLGAFQHRLPRHVRHDAVGIAEGAGELHRLIDPTGKSLRFIRSASQALEQKYFCFSEMKIELYVFPIPSHQEGRCATSPTRGGDAVDADGAPDERRSKRTAKSCGPDAPRLASSRRKQFRWRRWQKNPDRRGEHV